MTRDNEQESRDAAAEAAENSAGREKQTIRKKRVRRVVRGCVIAGAIFCVGYEVGVHRQEIGEFLKNSGEAERRFIRRYCPVSIQK